MCGIAGLVYGDGSRDAAARAVRNMIALQRHRGPDGEGFFDAEGVCLGHRRLAILDLTKAGHQPMADPTGRYWITFNGEIYNYLELAQELKQLGHSWQGHCDTEVLLAAYCQWGSECLSRLRGMFAFAIWDTREKSLFAARDRLGIKPFHYWTDGKNRFAFASELKALLQFQPERRANQRLAQQFVAWNLLDHEPAHTMLEDIFRLPPAHSMTWRHGAGIKMHCYWKLQVNPELDTSPARAKNLVSEFRDRLSESISLHLRSDVPVGTCLSGGLDSSAIVCLVNLMLRQQGAEHQQHTFSACFGDPALDERPYIQEVVAATGCKSQFVFPDGDRLRDELEACLWHQEEPFGGTGPYAQYCVARLASEHGVKVLLDGQGADEQLAGYRKFIFTYLRQLAGAGRRKQALREALAFFSSRDILRTSSLVDGRRYLFKSSREVSELWPGGTQPQKPAALGFGGSLADRVVFDLELFSLPLLLRFEDRNMMAFGIESRVPFVDHVLVEWIAALPADMRLRDGWTKYIMRQALDGILPEPIRTRKSKLGFSTPEKAWLDGPLAGWLRETLETAQFLEGVVDTSGVGNLRRQYAAGDKSPALQAMLCRLAIFETWSRRFVGGDASSFSPA